MQEEKIRKAFLNTQIEPEQGSASGIWQTMKLREKRNARRKLWLLSTLGIASLSGAVSMIILTLNNLAGSGFYEYFSLAFSNSQTVLAHFEEFTMSIMESLPIMSLAFSFFLIFIFFLSVRVAGKQIEGAALSF